MTSSSSLLCKRFSEPNNGKSFMINDILQTQAQVNLDRHAKRTRSFGSMYPLLMNQREFGTENLLTSDRLFPGFLPMVRSSSAPAGMTPVPGRINPYHKMGFNFMPPHAGYFLSRAAELMSDHCVLPPLPFPLPMQSYDQLPLYLRDRFLHLADAADGSRKCRRSRTVFSEVQLMALEERFERQKYLSTPDRMELAEGLGLTQLQVKTWYQNRRMKWKKQVQQADNSKPSSSDLSDTASLTSEPCQSGSGGSKHREGSFAAEELTHKNRIEKTAFNSRFPVHRSHQDSSPKPHFVKGGQRTYYAPRSGDM